MPRITHEGPGTRSFGQGCSGSRGAFSRIPDQPLGISGTARFDCLCDAGVGVCLVSSAPIQQYCLSVLLVTGILIGWDGTQNLPRRGLYGDYRALCHLGILLDRDQFTGAVAGSIYRTSGGDDPVGPNEADLSSGTHHAVRIQGAIAVYLLFGISWAYGYVIVMHSILTHFKARSECPNYLPSGCTSACHADDIGYGEITPLSTPARSLAIERP